MRFSRMAPRKFSTRLIAITLIAGLVPVVIVLLMIEIFTYRFPAEINRTIFQGQEEQWRCNEAVMKDIAEDFIRQKAMDVALQLELYLKARPEMTVKKLQNDSDFREIAVQPIGRTGHTSVLDSDTGINRFHINPNVEGKVAHPMSDKLPEFYAIIEASLGGRYAHGFYKWMEPDGAIRDKFMYIAPLSGKTADGVRFNVAATTYMDEFTMRIREAKDVSHSTARYMELTLNRLIRSSANLGFLLAGVSIFLILGFAFWVGGYLSRSIVRLREATRAINQGDFSVRVQHTTSSDVAELIEDFNLMAETLLTTTVKKQELEKSERKLKRTNIRLQQEITGHERADEQVKQSLKEKENLLAEIHHRVKNNMQIISSLLSLQSGHIKDKEALSLVKDCERRIKAMALVHEKLYLSGDLSRIDFSNYIENIAIQLFSAYGVDSRVITFSPRVNDVLFTIETAIPLGLVINELISNALKHAFPEGREGNITVDLLYDKEAEEHSLTVTDDGVGFPEGIDYRNSETFGLQLVEMLTEQLRGTIELDRAKGTSFRITFSEQAYRKRI